ncbi:MAG: hypothetical protein HYX67_08380 [Candidatus Melainabacteria bacterium]|nr:hypothetical protein [Candidatus Melainabacteria bacterium]
MSVNQVQRFEVRIPENINSTKTLIPVSDYAIAPRTGFSLCCARKEPAEKNRKAIVIFDKHMKHEYGEQVTSKALSQSNFNLSAAHSSGAPLSVSTAQSILMQAKEIKQLIPAIEKVIKNNFYYHKLQDKEEEFLPQDQGESPQFNLRYSGKFIVQKRNGEITFFDPKPIQKELETLCFEKPLPPEKMTEFLAEVKQELESKTKQMVTLSTDTIREAILNVMRKKDIQVQRPPILDALKGNPDLDNFIKRKRISDLRANEFDLVFEFVAKGGTQTYSQYPNPKDEQ